MKSPFPGMDPYLERHWRDVHAELISLARTALNKELPSDLIARMEERIVIDDLQHETQRTIFPDVRVYGDQNAAKSESASATAVIAEPIILELEVEPHTETYLTIVDAEGGELVTVIEVLSPTNKLPGEDREQYRRKRSELVTSHVNVVEIDLIRAGSWQELLMPYVAPPRGKSTYRVVTRRVHPKQRAELYPISLRQRLPIIRIPLRANDQDVPLDLQSLFEQVYENGRYDRSRYASPCEPLLEAAEAQWADELLRSAGKR
jgi:hypothetical protein